MFEVNFVDLRSLFKNFYTRPKLDFSKISEERKNYLKNQAENLNKFFDTEKYNYSKVYKYSKKIERINGVCGGNIKDNVPFSTKTPEEKYLLFIYAVDPEFENAIIHLSETQKDNIKRNCMEKFGIYDPNLIKIELQVIKQFLTEQKRKEIYEEVDKRAFK